MRSAPEPEPEEGEPETDVQVPRWRTEVEKRLHDMRTRLDDLEARAPEPDSEPEPEYEQARDDEVRHVANVIEKFASIPDSLLFDDDVRHEVVRRLRSRPSEEAVDNVARELHRIDVERNDAVVQWDNMPPEHWAMYRYDAERLVCASLRTKEGDDG